MLFELRDGDKEREREIEKRETKGNFVFIEQM